MENRTYKVRSSDTFWGIARDQLGDPMKYRDLMRWNNIRNFKMKAGQVLKLYDPYLQENSEVKT